MTATVQIVGSLLVFAAHSSSRCGCPVLASVPQILALGAGCSVLVETVQYVLRLDRVSSVDDVLFNVGGRRHRGWRAASGTFTKPLGTPVRDSGSSEGRRP
ncbi:VanZ family protein [Actinomadura sp. WMMB 499]|uniref:VanZ family protein n=1 Tax=Actinomadura sp. WMMB 499 TaxID=1219491 RepID=UPI001C3F7259|nr:VanZ family protein [Actinomadura sp. WMMB 499]